MTSNLFSNLRNTKQIIKIRKTENAVLRNILQVRTKVIFTKTKTKKVGVILKKFKSKYASHTVLRLRIETKNGIRSSQRGRLTQRVEQGGDQPQDGMMS